MSGEMERARLGYSVREDWTDGHSYAPWFTTRTDRAMRNARRTEFFWRFRRDRPRLTLVPIDDITHSRHVGRRCQMVRCPRTPCTVRHFPRHSCELPPIPDTPDE